MSALGLDEIPLDPLIHVWVLLPLCALIFSFGVVKQYILLWCAEESTPSAVREEIAASMRRTRHLLSGDNIDEAFFISEYRSLTDPKNGKLKTLIQPSSLENIFDSRFMQKTLTRNVMGFLPNIAMVQFIDHFFSGVFVFRLPFAFPSCLRPLIQRGVDIDSISTSYVTALSFYFVILFAQAPFVDLLVGKVPNDSFSINFSQGKPSTKGFSQESYKQIIEELRKRKEQYFKNVKPPTQSEWSERNE
ncbi:PRTase-like protein [Perkinsela sp. CCAP 1560/4]|nr:PRTase-like protein [Perkinsela sp. CCAP 1560/4]|eukprot:KNH07504.1 PRTase-like protein [Perkinsela sp. CCAP 1560/4]